ncbi:hypothetical protein H6P81_016859 [Aristolochia fimbriata]|uniref:Trafficking protein particle complex subunit 13 n=1 Tax=Aristolochia fimbriata TaxID=158543 RepID=A0AAV7DWG4_ARIFI|nr:hypothetical protein H6P81_016859 [Aristolochia fimbriata]
MGSPTHGNHSLAFRVMRLCRPSFNSSAPLRLHPLDLIAGEDYLTAGDMRLPHDSDLSFRDRFLLGNPTDAMGLTGQLVLPQSFGAIYLGETFCSYISINNSSKFEARDVVIKAEIQTDRQRILLLDTSKSPVETIRSGGRYDFIVEHDVKELGPHTLVCTALYNDGDGERKYLPQFFKFVVANPLSVRTKVRAVKENTFLEASIENHTKTNLFMDQVDFEPAPQWTVTVLKADEDSGDSKIDGLFKPPALLKAGGGIQNYLYQLKLTQETAPVKPTGTNILGKLQITWRSNLGEPGRLQTQHILGNPIALNEIELRLAEIPQVINLERPFLVRLSLANQTDRKIGPFEILSQVDSLEDVVMINGLQNLVLPPLDASESTDFNLNLIATRLGVQKISGITVCDAKEKKIYDTLADLEIFVSSEC